MLDKKNLFELAIQTAKAVPYSKSAYSYNNVSFSYEDLDNTFREELNFYLGTYSLFRENKNLVFELIETVIDEVLPIRVIEQYGQFAETKVFAQGEKPIFTQKISVASKRRALQFITKVGLAGIYEVFKLDSQTYEVPTSAFGGAAQIGLEEFLDGRITFADVLNIVMEGLDRAIYIEIERALKGAVTNIQATNKASETGFVESSMDKLLEVADSYGVKSTIYCTFEFASTMIPSDGWISDAMKDQKWENGYLANYKGHRVIVLAQSFEDETNTTKVIDPSYAWIIPGGAKPVKIAIEGQTLSRERENDDWSREIQTYKKVGVAAIVTNNICVYRNTSLAV